MSDNLFVNRNNTTYQVDMENLRTIEDTDLLLVNRNGTTYTVTGDQIGGGGGEITQVNLAPLSGTPQFEVTATTDLSEILPESTINYKWYRYTGSTGGTGTLLQELTSDSAILNTYTTTAADQGYYIGCTVTYLGVTVTETARTQCLVAPGPVATMSGLRFDSARQTKLERSFTGSHASYTLSFWYKQTAVNANNFFWVGPGNAYNVFGLSPSNEFQVTNSDGGGDMSVSLDAYNLFNRWVHFVVQKDGALNEIKLFINGALVNTVSSTSPIDFDLGPASIGMWRSTNAYLNGYLSDYYLVTDKALPPTTFGKTFEPYGWGPLDSSQIIENINNFPVLAPYDTRANTDEVWSDGIYDLNGGSPGNIPLSFDGDITTGPLLQNSGSQSVGTYDFRRVGGAIATNSVEIFSLESANSVCAISINGEAFTTFPSVAASVGASFAVASGQLETIAIKNIAATSAAISGISAIKTYGRLLVDQGVWNASQNWSDNVAMTGNQPGQYIADFFNGNIENGVHAAGNQTCILDFTDFPAGSYELYFKRSANTASGDDLVTVNGSTFLAPDQQWLAVSGFELTQITLQNPGRNVLLTAIKLNGAILVDAGAQWNTSQVWSDGVTGSYVDNPAFAFDSQDTTHFYTVDQSTPLIINIPIATTSLIVDVLDYSFLPTGDAGPGQISIDGGTTWTRAKDTGTRIAGPFDVPGNQYAKRYRIELPTGLSNIQFRSTDSGYGSGAFMFTVDGEILVDKASFGANGFYLPFDPAVVVDPNPTNATWDPLLNGMLANPVLEIDSVTKYTADIVTNKTFNFTNTPNGTWTIYCGNFANSTNNWDDNVRVNGSSIPKNPTSDYGGNPVYHNKYEFTGTLNSIDVDRSINGLYGSILFLILFNGAAWTPYKSLYNSISVDASGNENNFLDQNFGVGNTSENWSKYVSSTGIVNIGDSFDGSEHTFPTKDSGLPEATMVFEPALTNVTSLRLFVNEDQDGSGSRYAVVNGNSDPIGRIINQWRDFTSLLDGTTLSSLGFYGTGNAASSFGISVIEVNGVVLVDTNQQDTVTDTPMMNYAVLGGAVDGASGTPYNGNLEIQTNNYSTAGTIALTSGKCYFEEAVISASPAYGNSIGVVIDNTSYVYGAYNGNTGGSVYAAGSSVTSYGEQFGPGDLIGVAVDRDNNSLIFYKNGVSQGIATTVLPSGDIRPYVNDYSGASTHVALNFGQQPFAASNVIYDQATGIATIGGVAYNTLFQTWEQSKVVTFRAQIAAADVLMAALTEHAQTYSPLEDYCEGTVIKAFGELWVAITDVTATTFADLQAIRSNANWNRLGITV